MDEASFEAVVSAHYEGLYRFALSLARSGDAASDLTQETFYRFATKGSQLRDPSKAKSWLFTTLYRQFLAQQRHRTRFPHAELTEAEADLPAIEPAAVDAMDARLVMDALQGLEETYRAPLALFYLGDHSYKEIARVLDIPIGTVMSRLSRAKMLLRQQLRTVLQEDTGKVVPLQTLPNTRGRAL